MCAQMIEARTNHSNHMNSSTATARRNAAVYLRKDLRPSTRTEKHKYNQSRAYVIARVLEILIQTQSVFTGTYALRSTQSTEPTIRFKDTRRSPPETQLDSQSPGEPKQRLPGDMCIKIA